MSNLAIYEKINVIGFFSDGYSGSHADEESPQVENKYILFYNILTLNLSVLYYYRFVRVQSGRGRQLLSERNHQYTKIDDEKEDLAMEQSTFMFQGILFRTLPYLNGAPTITCVDTFNNGVEQEFNITQVRELISLHNQSADNIIDDDL